MHALKPAVGILTTMLLGCAAGTDGAPQGQLAARLAKLEGRVAELEARGVVADRAVPVAAQEPKAFTIARAYWFHSEQRPASIKASEVPVDDAGHVLVHVEEDVRRSGVPVYKRIDKNFVLKADGHADVKAQAKRGWWNHEFYIQIAPPEYSKMATGVPYALDAMNSMPGARWVVKTGVTITKQ